jgi:hypothetical protein
MSRKARAIATASAGLLVTCGMLVAATASSAAISINLPNWAVYGSLTPKTLNEPVILPKGSTFNGAVTVTRLTNEIEATIAGKLFVPPFTASLKLAGAVPTTVGVTLTEVGESTGTITPRPFTECAQTRVGEACAKLAVNAKAIIGITATGILGIEVPTHCETTEPVDLPLGATLTVAELLNETHFAGTVTIPPIKCEGLQGLVLAALLTQLMSGPGNPYAISLAPQEPTPPVVAAEPARSVSQSAAQLHGNAAPSGEPITDCHFEYGTSTSYGASVPCEADAHDPFFYQANFRYAFPTGLTEGTVYHYRLVATNSLGTSTSGDATFKTLGPGGGPEYGRCVAQKHGEYAVSNCAIKSKKPHKGRFEWQPGPARPCFPLEKGEYTNSSCTVKAKKVHKGTFERGPGPRFTSTSGPITLEAPEPGTWKVVCTAGTGTGEVTGRNTGVERIAFTGCETSGKKCASEGSNGSPSGKAGVIDTNLLHMRLLGPVQGPFGQPRVLTQLASGEHEPYLAEFGCEGALSRVKGYVSGVQRENVGTPSATSQTTIEPRHGERGLREGEQALFSELSENGGSSWTGAASAGMTMVLTNTAELSAGEIKPYPVKSA